MVASLINRILARALKSPDALILTQSDGKAISYRRFVERADSLGAGLLNQGFKPGDRVLFLIRPSIESMCCLFSVISLGGVPIYADPGMGESVFRERMRLAKPKWVFAEPIVVLLDGFSWLREWLVAKGIAIPSIPKAAKIVQVGGSIRCGKVIHAKAMRTSEIPKLHDLKSEDEAFIVFTSGSTTAPRAVVHSVGSFSKTIDAIVDLCAPRGDDVFYGDLPHFLLVSLLVGMPSILPKKNTPAAFMKDALRYRPTVVFGAPATFINLIGHCKRNRLSFPPSIQRIYVGSAPVSSGFLSRLYRVVSPECDVICVYGMTEILPAMKISGKEKIGSREGDLIGRPVPGVKARLAAGGELVLASDHQCIRYLGGPTLKEIKTGDLARKTKKGYALIGRKKDMIIRGNFNVYPSLYEPLVEGLPGVSACAMIGIKDAVTEDERIVLFVEPTGRRAGFGELISRQLPGLIDKSALPDEVIVATLPRKGRQQKIDKEKLRRSR